MIETQDLTARHNTIQKLATHFKIKKDALQKEVLKYQEEAESPIIRAQLLEDCNFSYYLYPVHAEKIELTEFLSFEKFKKSVLHQFYEKGEGYVPAIIKTTKYIMAVYTKGFLWVIYRSKGYEGPGGIFIGSSKQGFTIEPINNFLNNRYPQNTAQIDLD